MIVNGYHGTTAASASQIITSGSFFVSNGPGEWLGDGVYFWQDAPLRALIWARAKAKQHALPESQAVVLKVRIDISDCFDLLDIKYWRYLEDVYAAQDRAAKLAGKKLIQAGPVYKKENGKLVTANPAKGLSVGNNVVDCSVLNVAINLAKNSVGTIKYNCIRATFFDGKQIYENSYFLDHNHVQIAVRDQSIIKSVRLMNSNQLNSDFKKYLG